MLQKNMKNIQKISSLALLLASIFVSQASTDSQTESLGTAPALADLPAPVPADTPAEGKPETDKAAGTAADKPDAATDNKPEVDVPAAIVDSVIAADAPMATDTDAPIVVAAAKSEEENTASTSGDLSDSKKGKKVNQKELFNMIRKGVVAITATGHIIMERVINDKRWSGTGFIANLDKGLIVTNSHVAGEMAVCTYEVKFGNGTKADAKLVYIDPCYDIAVLSVDPKNIPQDSIALEMSSEKVAVNTAVYSMGNSLGNEFSTYSGTIFDINSILWLKVFPEQSMQFSGLTVPGASGSPVFGDDGKVLGLLYGGRFVSGAALPIAYVRPIIEALSKGEKFQRYFYGFMVDYLTLQDAKEVGMVPTEFVTEYDKKYPEANNKILYVTKNIASFKTITDIQSGDIIVKVNGEEIGCSLQKLDEVVQKSEGKELSIEVYRNGKLKTIKTIPQLMSSVEKLKLLSFAGATFFETNDDVKVVEKVNKQAVFITNSEPGSPFNAVTNYGGNDSYYSRGLYQITALNGHEIRSLEDLAKVLPELMNTSSFLIRFIKLPSDGEEVTVRTKYSPEFAEALMATFDRKDSSWDVKNYKNPSQTQVEK